MRKQFGLKFELDWMQAVDVAAAEAGISRTDYIERAVELQMRRPSTLTLGKELTRRRGVRIAYVCDKCEPPPRRFVGADDPVPRCDKHGKMTLQPNNTYFGRKT